jgi:diadenosine tetraphosphate (Ap4A) HIT family hydrolase
MQAKASQTMPLDQPHATLRKFGYPQNLLHEGEHWAVLVRPQQPTLGSLVLCATSNSVRFGDLEPEAFAEQGRLIARIEQTLATFCSHEKVNYLMLMMVDPHVHFHVVPRYSGERNWEGISFPDSGWPGLPDLGKATSSSEQLVRAIQQAWNDNG